MDYLVTNSLIWASAKPNNGEYFRTVTKDQWNWLFSAWSRDWGIMWEHMEWNAPEIWRQQFSVFLIDQPEIRTA